LFNIGLLFFLENITARRCRFSARID